MTHDDSTTNTQSKATGGDDLIVLLCAPNHDRLTEFTSKLLDDFPSLGAPTQLCTFSNPLTYEQLLTNLSIDPRTTNLAVVFCGHGEDSSLEGPGAHPGSPDYSESRSSFYNDSSLHLGPTLLLAACCNAALGLGKAFERKTDGRTFIGFDDEIGFVTKGGVYADWWRRVLHGSAVAMLKATDIDDLRKSVQQTYKDALSFFDPRTGGNYRYGLMMSAYLRRQLEAIDFIRTT